MAKNIANNETYTQDETTNVSTERNHDACSTVDNQAMPPEQQEKALKLWLEEALLDSEIDKINVDIAENIAKKFAIGIRNGDIVINKFPTRHNFHFQLFFSKSRRILSLISLIAEKCNISNINLDEIEVNVVKGSYQTVSNREASTDLLVECKLRTGEKFIFILLGEHKVAHDMNAIIQLLRYTVETIWSYRNTKGYTTAPDIIPFLIIIGNEDWTPKTFKEMVANKLVDPDIFLIFNPLVLHILRIPDDILKSLGKYSYIPNP
jgi:hypothetical protein